MQTLLKSTREKLEKKTAAAETAKEYFPMRVRKFARNECSKCVATDTHTHTETETYRTTTRRSIYLLKRFFFHRYFNRLYAASIVLHTLLQTAI